MKEAEIRPAALFDRYLDLCRHDAETFFRADEWETVACPACGADGDHVFHKHGFDYRHCAVCATLFASPRPSAAALGRYYTDAPSARFWATDFYRETEDARREKMFRPRAARVREILDGIRAGGRRRLSISAPATASSARKSGRSSGVPVHAINPARPSPTSARRKDFPSSASFSRMSERAICRPARDRTSSRASSSSNIFRCREPFSSGCAPSFVRRTS